MVEETKKNKWKFLEEVVMFIVYLLIVASVIFGIGWVKYVVFGNMTTGQYIQKVRDEWPRQIAKGYERITNTIKRASDISDIEVKK